MLQRKMTWYIQQNNDIKKKEMYVPYLDPDLSKLTLK